MDGLPQVLHRLKRFCMSRHKAGAGVIPLSAAEMKKGFHREAFLRGEQLRQQQPPYTRLRYSPVRVSISILSSW
ncbi:hypothetical protein ACLBXN_05100, partial [Comamonas sp. C24C]